MTGPEHYREAERFARLASNYTGLPDNRNIQAGQIAQAHATLAAAALHAAAEMVRLGVLPPAALAGWEEIGTALPEDPEAAVTAAGQQEEP